MKIEIIYEKLLLEILPSLSDDTVNELLKHDRKMIDYCERAEQAELKYFKARKNMSDDDKKAVKDHISAQEMMT